MAGKRMILNTIPSPQANASPAIIPAALKLTARFAAATAILGIQHKLYKLQAVAERPAKSISQQAG
jgi:hypothetical protein